MPASAAISVFGLMPAAMITMSVSMTFPLLVITFSTLSVPSNAVIASEVIISTLSLAIARISSLTRSLISGSRRESM